MENKHVMTEEKLKQWLIEIVRTAKIEINYCSSDGIPIVTTERQIVDDREVSPLIDHLIANGVTIRENAYWKTREDKNDYLWVECSNCGFMVENYKAVKLGLNSTDVIGYKYHSCPVCTAKMVLPVKEGV